MTHAKHALPATAPSDTPTAERVPLRVATWNIRKAMGTDRRRDPERILQILAALRADVVLLQEADFRRPPRRPIFTLSEIASVCGLTPMTLHHGRESLGWHGNVILTAPEVQQIAAHHYDLPGLEPRGAVEAHLAKSGADFRAFGVHLGLLRRSRREQLTAMLALMAGSAAPTLIAGDFNERSQNVGLGRLAPRFRILSGGPTYHARVPLFALDRIAISPEFEAERLEVFHSDAARLASDHLPLIADLRLEAAPQLL